MSAADKKTRSQRILELSDRFTHTFYDRYIGTTRSVLLEHSNTPGFINGFTDNYIKVEIESKDTASLDNRIVNVSLQGWNAEGAALVGRIIR